MIIKNIVKNITKFEELNILHLSILRQFEKLFLQNKIRAETDYQSGLKLLDDYISGFVSTVGYIVRDVENNKPKELKEIVKDFKKAQKSLESKKEYFIAPFIKKYDMELTWAIEELELVLNFLKK